MKILAKHGFKYEASVCPVWTPQYGVPGAPLYCYRTSLNDLTIEDKEIPILELPMTVLNMGVKFPVAGGILVANNAIVVLQMGVEEGKQGTSVYGIYPSLGNLLGNPQDKMHLAS
mgnify:FL=1